MRKAAAIGAVSLLLCASAARGAGVSLFWDQCFDDGGLQNRRFDCNTDEGGFSLVGGFMLDFDLASVNGAEMVLFLNVGTGTLPAWWQFVNAGACRQTALSIAPYDSPTCPDALQGLASLSITGYQPGTPNQRSALMLSTASIAEPGSVDLFASTPYSVARWIFSNVGTTGAGACAGCFTSACWRFESLRLTTVGHANDVILTQWSGPGTNFVTWQGGAGTACEPTPTRNSTWGAVKSLYR